MTIPLVVIAYVMLVWIWSEWVRKQFEKCDDRAREGV